MSEPEFRVDAEHFEALDAGLATWLLAALNDGLAKTLVVGLRSHLPTPDAWRLTITGDMVASIHAIERREEGHAYTLDRGVGRVAARTLNAPDGTFDIVIDARSFMPDSEPSSREELIDYMHAIGLHLAIHESGHAILHKRGEDVPAFQDLVVGTKTEWVWRKLLAAHVDDFRIEKMTNRLAPSPLSKVADLGHTLAHLRSELTESSALSHTDRDAAECRSSIAVNDLLRVMTYLSAELGAGGRIAREMRPQPLPEGWNEYLEDVWDAWALTLDRLESADEPMAVDEIASVLADLCRIVVVWLGRTVGYHFEMHEDGSGTANWSRSIY